MSQTEKEPEPKKLFTLLFYFNIVSSVQVSQTFYITIKPVDDSLPLLLVPGMRVQEGVRKTITEFELKTTDADTEVGHWLHKSSATLFI